MTRDTSTRLIAEANQALADWERQTTGQHKALVRDLMDKHTQAARAKWVWGIIATLATSAIGYGAWWTWGAVSDKAKAAITADLAAKVETQNTANNKAHEVMTTNITTVGNKVGAVETKLDDQGTMLEALFDMRTQPTLDPQTVRAKVTRKRAALKAAQPKDNQP